MCVFLVLFVLLVLFCVSFLFRHCDGPIGLCTSSFHQDEEFVTALINWQFAACNSVLIDLAKAEAMDRKKKACAHAGRLTLSSAKENGTHLLWRRTQTNLMLAW